MNSEWTPTYMAIGHNFGCEDYREALEREGRGREDNIVGTWRSLDRLLRAAGVDPNLCFRTNWFVGLLPGSKNEGSFLIEDDEGYEAACSKLLLEQIHTLRPRVILLLGPVVTKRAYRISPSLECWRYPAKKSITFSDIDAKGHTVCDAQIHGGHEAKIVSLLHPSKGWLNEPRRKKSIGLSEAEVIRAAFASTKP